MDPQGKTQTAERISTNGSFVQKMIVWTLLALIFIFIGIIITFLFTSYNSSKENDNTNVPLPTKDDTNLIKPNLEGVQKAFSYYTLLGRVQEITSSNETITLTLINPVGQDIITKKPIRYNREVLQVLRLNGDNTSSPAALIDVKKDMIIELNMGYDLKTNTYDVSNIYIHSM